MSLLPTDLVGQVKTGIIAVLAILVLTVIAYLSWSKSVLAVENARLKDATAALALANQEWEQQVHDANAALTDLKDREDKVAKLVAEAQRQASITAEKDSASAQAFASLPTYGDDCNQAKQLTKAFFGSNR